VDQRLALATPESNHFSPYMRTYMYYIHGILFIPSHPIPNRKSIVITNAAVSKVPIPIQISMAITSPHVKAFFPALLGFLALLIMDVYSLFAWWCGRWFLILVAEESGVRAISITVGTSMDC